MDNRALLELRIEARCGFEGYARIAMVKRRLDFALSLSLSSYILCGMAGLEVISRTFD